MKAGDALRAIDLALPFLGEAGGSEELWHACRLGRTCRAGEARFPSCCIAWAWEELLEHWDEVRRIQDIEEERWWADAQLGTEMFLGCFNDAQWEDE